MQKFYGKKQKCGNKHGITKSHVKNGSRIIEFMVVVFVSIMLMQDIKNLVRKYEHCLN